MIRLTWPSTTPELQGRVRPARTASMSRARLSAKPCSSGILAVLGGVEPAVDSLVALAIDEHLGELRDQCAENGQVRATGGEPFE